MSIDEEDRDAAERLATLIRRLKGLAGGRLGVMKEMRELDGKLGLNPQAMAQLRWKIVDDSEEAKQPQGRRSAARPKPKRTAASRRHLRAVDSTAA